MLGGVLDELGLTPPATRAGALCRLLGGGRGRHLRARIARSRLPGRAGGDHGARPPAPGSLSVAWITGSSPPEYLTRYQVLASRTADPRCIGLALYVEVNIAAVRGGAGRDGPGRALEALAAVAARSGDPYVLGQEKSTRSLIDIELGRWAHGRAHRAQAMQLLRECCLGASYETGMAAGHYFMCLFYIGDVRLHGELLPLLREAEERRDHFTLATLHGFAGVASLIQGQPEVARGSWPSEVRRCGP